MSINWSTFNFIENRKIRIQKKQVGKYQEGMDALFGLIESPYKFKSFRDAYVEITKDPEITGINNNKDYNYSEILENTIQKYFDYKYSLLDNNWRGIIKIQTNIQDFRPKPLYKIKTEDNLKIFNDSENTLTMKIVDEKNDYYNPDIRYSPFLISEKDIRDNFLEGIKQRIDFLVSNCHKTLTMFIGSVLIGGSTYLVNNNSNYVIQSKLNSDKIENQKRQLYMLDNAHCLQLTESTLQNAILRLTNNSGLSQYKTLVIPCELENTYRTILDTTKDRQIHNIKLVIFNKDYLGGVSRNWYLMESDENSPIQIGFVDDKEEPWIMLSSDPSLFNRAFSHGGLQFACSHRYGGGISNWRNIFGSVYVD